MDKDLYLQKLKYFFSLNIPTFMVGRDGIESLCPYLLEITLSLLIDFYSILMTHFFSVLLNYRSPDPIKLLKIVNEHVNFRKMIRHLKTKTSLYV